MICAGDVFFFRDTTPPTAADGVLNVLVVQGSQLVYVPRCTAAYVNQKMGPCYWARSHEELETTTPTPKESQG